VGRWDHSAGGGKGSRSSPARTGQRGVRRGLDRGLVQSLAGQEPAGGIAPPSAQRAKADHDGY
jgi:hypothetical protein